MRVHVFKGRKVPKHVDGPILFCNVFCQSKAAFYLIPNLEVMEYMFCESQNLAKCCNGSLRKKELGSWSLQTCAPCKTQSRDSLEKNAAWSESSLSVWRNTGSYSINRDRRLTWVYACPKRHYHAFRLIHRQPYFVFVVFYRAKTHFHIQM